MEEHAEQARMHRTAAGCPQAATASEAQSRPPPDMAPIISAIMAVHMTATTRARSRHR